MPTILNFSVRLTGLEPARRETLDPKSSASTNSATGASSLRRFCRLRMQRYDKKKKRPNYSTKSFLAASIIVSIPFIVSSSVSCTL